MAIKRGGSIVKLLLVTYACRWKAMALVLACSLMLAAAAQNETAVDTVVDYQEYTDEPPPAASMSEDEPSYFMQKGMLGGMDSIVLRQLPDSVVNALRANEDYLYGEKTKQDHASSNPNSGQGNKATVVENKQTKTNRSLSDQRWFQQLLLGLIIAGFMAFLVAWLYNSNIKLFRRKSRAMEQGEQEELSTEDIFAINYQREIDKAAANGDYRLAIRLMFLRLLKNMAERNIIRYKQDSTNLDYLAQLNNSSYYHDFFRIARNYEYSWYGQFEIKDDAYRIIRNDFDNFDRKLR